MKQAELFDIKNHVAIVTGAASGLGLAFAEVMARERRQRRHGRSSTKRSSAAMRRGSPLRAARSRPACSMSPTPTRCAP